MHVILSLPADWARIAQQHRSRWERAISQPRSTNQDRRRRRKIEAALRVIYTRLGHRFPAVTWLESFPGLTRSGSTLGGRGGEEAPWQLVAVPPAPDGLQRIAWQSICRLQLAVRLGARLDRRALKILAALSKLLRHTGGCLLTRTQATIVQRPVQLLYNSGMIHATHTPAVVWADHLALEVWYGQPTRVPREYVGVEPFVMQFTTRSAPNPIWATTTTGNWVHLALSGVRFGELFFRPQHAQSWCRLRAAWASNWEQVEHGIGRRLPEPVSAEALTQYFYWMLSEAGQMPDPPPGAPRVMPRTVRPPVDLRRDSLW